MSKKDESHLLLPSGLGRCFKECNTFLSICLILNVIMYQAYKYLLSIPSIHVDEIQQRSVFSRSAELWSLHETGSTMDDCRARSALTGPSQMNLYRHWLDWGLKLTRVWLQRTAHGSLGVMFSRARSTLQFTSVPWNYYWLPQSTYRQ